jgi:hypothetical protein
MRHFGLREENAYCVLKDEKPVQTVQAVHRFTPFKAFNRYDHQIRGTFQSFQTFNLSRG